MTWAEQVRSFIPLASLLVVLALTAPPAVAGAIQAELDAGPLAKIEGDLSVNLAEPALILRNVTDPRGLVVSAERMTVTYHEMLFLATSDSADGRFAYKLSERHDPYPFNATTLSFSNPQDESFITLAASPETPAAASRLHGALATFALQASGPGRVSSDLGFRTADTPAGYEYSRDIDYPHILLTGRTGSLTIGGNLDGYAFGVEVTATSQDGRQQAFETGEFLSNKTALTHHRSLRWVTIEAQGANLVHDASGRDAMTLLARRAAGPVEGAISLEDVSGQVHLGDAVVSPERTSLRLRGTFEAGFSSLIAPPSSTPQAEGAPRLGIGVTGDWAEAQVGEDLVFAQRAVAAPNGLAGPLWWTAGGLLLVVGAVTAWALTSPRRGRAPNPVEAVGESPEEDPPGPSRRQAPPFWRPRPGRRTREFQHIAAIHAWLETMNITWETAERVAVRACATDRGVTGDELAEYFLEAVEGHPRYKERVLDFVAILVQLGRIERDTEGRYFARNRADEPYVVAFLELTQSEYEMLKRTVGLAKVQAWAVDDTDRL